MREAAVRHKESGAGRKARRRYRVSVSCFCLLASCFWFPAPARAQDADDSPRSAPPPSVAVSKIEILVPLSSKMKTGTPFKAKVVQAGVGLSTASVVTGHIVTNKAGWFHRAGYLGLVFDTIENPPHYFVTDFIHDERADYVPDPAKIDLLDVPGQRIDSEGMVRARKSKKRVLLQIGSAVLAGKVADDATDGLLLLLGGSANGWPSRIVALAAAGTVWAVEKGSNVNLKRGTVISVLVEQVKFNGVVDAE